MASQEQLILAQFGAEAADIYKPDASSGGLYEDLTAAAMGVQAFDEASYALKTQVGKFQDKFMAGQYAQKGGLLQKLGESAFGPYSKEVSQSYFSEKRKSDPSMAKEMELYNPDTGKVESVDLTKIPDVPNGDMGLANQQLLYSGTAELYLRNIKDTALDLRGNYTTPNVQETTRFSFMGTPNALFQAVQRQNRYKASYGEDGGAGGGAGGGGGGGAG